MPDGFPPQEIVLAVDIGGTKVASAVFAADGARLTPTLKCAVAFGADHRADPQELVAALAPWVAQAKALPGNLRGIGLSCCGAVDHERGVMVVSSSLGWRDVPIGSLVADAYGLPVTTAADVRMAALAEATWGAARGVRNFAWVTIGTGFGGHLFLDGKLYDGTHGLAGNIGHVTLDEQRGEACGCGRRGCYETYVAGPAIARAGQHAAEEGASPYLQALARVRPITTQDVFTAEAAGDAAAHAIVESVIRLIALNLGGLVNILDLDLIVMGGGVIRGYPPLIDRISHRLRDFLLTEESRRDLTVVPESFDNSALVGAAAEVFLRQGLTIRSPEKGA